ncbi:MAG TPA: ATP-binding protein [Syntrophorhabdaceae bacterium]|jgi:tRNA 2-thiocytidine biosynthesis protein TtcA
MNVAKGLYSITKKVGKAVWDYQMLKEGDKIMVAVSGGKDSLCLLRIMQERMKYVPVRHEIVACHVDMGFPWMDIAGLVKYFEQEEVPYVIAHPSEKWRGDEEAPGCFWCSWNRRKALFDEVRHRGATKLAFAHHMDDIVETMLLNLFFQGEIGTMQPCQEMFHGKLHIIRPLAYVEEKELVRLATRLELPVIASKCPHGDTSKRSMVKGLVTELKKHNRNVKKNIFRSHTRIRTDYLLDKADLPLRGTVEKKG